MVESLIVGNIGPGFVRFIPANEGELALVKGNFFGPDESDPVAERVFERPCGKRKKDKKSSVAHPIFYFETERFSTNNFGTRTAENNLKEQSVCVLFCSENVF